MINFVFIWPTDNPDIILVFKKSCNRISANWDNGLCTQLGLFLLACLKSVCVRSRVHGDDPPSAPLECLQCAQRRRSAQVPGVCARACCGPPAVWLSEPVIQPADTENKHIWKEAHNTGMHMGTTNCRILHNNLLRWYHELGQAAFIRLCHKVMCMKILFPLGEKRRGGGPEGLCVVVWNKPGGKSEGGTHVNS